ncbi:hypothetical protein ES703_74488 [subsurface metagenome]
MKQRSWKVGWYSKVVLTVIAVSLGGLLVRQAPIEVKAEQEFNIDEYIEYGLTRADCEALITKFMQKVCTTESWTAIELITQVLMPYISKEYFESRWLNPDDFDVNFYSPSEFRILKVKIPYVDVEIIGGTETKWTKQLRFKVIREQNSFVIFPSRVEKTAYGNWVDPWWAIREEGITIGEIEPKKEVAPREPFLFENVTVWKVFKRDTGAVLGTELKGEVINQSGVSYNYSTWFQVTLYDRTGGVLGSKSFMLFGLRDGQRKPFEVTIYGADPADVQNWKIGFDRGS